MPLYESYPTTNGRCLLNWQTFRGFDQSRQKIRERLFNRFGYEVIKVDLLKEARSLVGSGDYLRLADPGLAPGKLDCSSLMMYLYALCGVVLPRFTLEQRSFPLGERISIEEASIGDLVFSTGKYHYYRTDNHDNVGHVGLATGKGTIINAINLDPENSAPAIYEHSVQDFLADREARGACRILPPQQDRLVLKMPPDREVFWSSDIFCLLSTTFSSSSESADTKVA